MPKFDRRRRVGYLVASYEGIRPAKDSVLPASATIQRHINAIRRFGHSETAEVTHLLFVINSDAVVDEGSNEPFEDWGTTDCGLRILVKRRPNRGFSYGAWEAGLLALCESGIDVDDYFLIEDDYEPSVPKFLEFFYEFSAPQVGFVAQKLDRIPGTAPTHAVVSNGLVHGAALIDVVNRFGRAFEIYSGNMNASDHLMGCENQITFLMLFEAAGWELVGISNEYSVPFLEAERKIIERGARGAIAPISPSHES